MATRTIISQNRRQRLIISTINTHLPLFNECGMEFYTQIRRRKNYVWWNPATWGGGFEWINSNTAIQPNIISFLFFRADGAPRNPTEFNLTTEQNTGYFKTSAYSSNVSNPAANDVSRVINVTLEFEYDGRNNNLR